MLRPATSTYLDLIRFLAALVVFVSHVTWNKLSGGFLWQFAPFGHPAVMVFFVLSGFVVAHAVSAPGISAAQYYIARFSRLYSVVIPAIILTLVCDRVGISINSKPYALEDNTFPILRAFLALIYLNTVWDIRLTFLSNGAYWSIPFEFWYYVLFGALHFCRGWRRLLLAGLAALVAGPHILLFAPIWLMGVAAYRLSQRQALPSRWAALLFGLSLALALAITLLADGFRLAQRKEEAGWPPGYHPVDFLLGLTLAVHFYAVSQLNLPLARWAGGIRYAAGYTFSLYLYHLPLLHLLAALLPSEWPVAARGLVMLAVTPVMVWALGNVTEKRRDGLRRLMERGVRRRWPRLLDTGKNS